jgi:hypothetical protein
LESRIRPFASSVHGRGLRDGGLLLGGGRGDGGGGFGGGLLDPLLRLLHLGAGLVGLGFELGEGAGVELAAELDEHAACVESHALTPSCCAAA